MFQFREILTTQDSLTAYAELFKTCFPKAHHLTSKYLSWLYNDNPDGKVVGFDAYHDGRLAAHYACIPVRLRLAGVEGVGLLSLNTATHPEHQGQGLFTKLAGLTYERAAGLGHLGVYGVANGNSTHGFTRKLGFALVSPLEARIGIGASAEIDWDMANRLADFQRVWDTQRLKWRCRSPANSMCVTSTTSTSVEAWANTDRVGVSAWASVAGSFPDWESNVRRRHFGTLFLGLLPAQAHHFRRSFSIPSKFRPSPLNFIYRPLNDSIKTIDRTKVVCSFIDFDAY